MGKELTPTNEYKVFNNCNQCYTWGWDVLLWHTSATCPTSFHCTNNPHQAG